MSVYQAAEELQERLERSDWLTAVAVGEVDGKEVIYVYLRRPVRNAELDALKRDGWKGFPVLVEKVGNIYPANA